ncbi:hypothetical protein FIV42_01510 [Persicimonas caeni]|uniref:Uncharacterized protein n=1 Tax=Persicimonas caeni TaxID=2292766 RepID=A0A4Y6PMH7_PERCE|nr:hypothetical protein [Persicimonas caeni]QDG49460.1 hypothetical protein FIV42_01510 [Persicimonas caeni]QED30681.1 hypothetical protein FRD00_01505 [Persicimonas caeni]
MSNDWSDEPGSNDGFGHEQSPWESPNTTDPGEPSASWETDPNNYDPVPMGPASITDVFNNLGTVMSRSLNSGVVGAFAALMIGQFVISIGGMIAVFATTVGIGALTGGDSDLAAASMGTGMFVGFGAIALFSMAVQLVLVGLFNPMRTALFEGPQPHHGFGWSLSKATENIGAIFVAGAAYVLLALPAVGLAALIDPLAALLWVPVVLVALFLLMPTMYYAATGHGVVGSFTKAFSTVTSNLVLFILFFVTVFVASLVLGCVNAILNFIPILGWLASMAIGIFSNYLGWAFYVSTLSTVESHELGRPMQ